MLNFSNSVSLEYLVNMFQGDNRRLKDRLSQGGLSVDDLEELQSENQRLRSDLDKARKVRTYYDSSKMVKVLLGSVRSSQSSYNYHGIYLAKALVALSLLWLKHLKKTSRLRQSLSKAPLPPTDKLPEKS